MTRDEVLMILTSTAQSCANLLRIKGGEYSSGDDALSNFKRAGISLSLQPTTIWMVYAAKHWDSITTWCKDEQAGAHRETSESITGRVDDLINYLILFKALYIERYRPAGESEPRVLPAGDVPWDAHRPDRSGPITGAGVSNLQHPRTYKGKPIDSSHLHGNIDHPRVPGS